MMGGTASQDGNYIYINLCLLSLRYKKKKQPFLEKNEKIYLAYFSQSSSVCLWASQTRKSDTRHYNHQARNAK